MLRLSWLLLRRDRQGQVGLAITTGAIAVAVLLLLVVTHFPQAMRQRGERLSWRSGYALEAVEPSSADAWWAMPVSGDRYQGIPIGRLHVATVNPQADPPPGLSRHPQPGEVWLSPALHELVRSVPSNQLGDRFPGQVAGEITSQGLTDPSELVAVVGVTVAEARRIGAIPVQSPYPTSQRVAGRLVPVASVLAAVAVLAPLLMLIASATRLQAAAHHRRLASLRLIGAIPRQVSRLTISAAATAGSLGSMLGLLAFIGVRPAVRIGILGVRFFDSDFTMSMFGWSVVALAPLLAVAGALLGLRRLNLSPLGVTRRARVDHLHPRRLWFLGGAILLFALTVGVVFSGGITEGLALTAIAAAFAFVVIGVIVAGPWITASVGSLLIKTARRPESILAGRRIRHDATGHYRLAMGLVLVALAGGLFYALIPALESEAARGVGAGLRPKVLMALMPVTGDDDGLQLQNTLRLSPWVNQVEATGEAFLPHEATGGLVIELGRCKELAFLLELGDVECGDSWVAVADDITVPARTLPITIWGRSEDIEVTLPRIPADAPRFHVDRIERFNDLIVDLDALGLSGDDLFRVLNLYISYDGDPINAERIRTLIVREIPTAHAYTAAEAQRASQAPLQQARGPVAAALVATLIVGGVSSAMNAAGSLLEHRQQLAQMRVVGIPLPGLKRVFMLEALAPLAIIATAATLCGIGVAGLLLAIGDYHTPALVDANGILILGVGLATGLVIAATPILFLDRATRYESIRTE